jgi:hypothetical protein
VCRVSAVEARAWYIWSFGLGRGRLALVLRRRVCEVCVCVRRVDSALVSFFRNVCVGDVQSARAGKGCDVGVSRQLVRAVEELAVVS